MIGLWLAYDLTTLYLIIIRADSIKESQYLKSGCLRVYNFLCFPDENLAFFSPGNIYLYPLFDVVQSSNHQSIARSPNQSSRIKLQGPYNLTAQNHV